MKRKPAESLKLVHSESATEDSSRISVAVSFSLEREPDVLEARFEVRAPRLRSDPSLARGESQWGLWEWDVVEVFLATAPPARAGETPKYFEFQLSPEGQYFELEIFKPRESINRDFHSGFNHDVSVAGDHATGGKIWQARMRIPLSALGWTGNPEHLTGGAFAILGEPGRKTYWGLFLPPQKVPDFHLPKYFGHFITK